MDLYVRNFHSGGTHDDFYTDKTIIAAFKNYVSKVVSRYANNPTVLGWELGNDLRCSSTLPASSSCNTNTITNWVADICKMTFFCPRPDLMYHCQRVSLRALILTTLSPPGKVHHLPNFAVDDHPTVMADFTVCNARSSLPLRVTRRQTPRSLAQLLMDRTA